MKFFFLSFIITISVTARAQFFPVKTTRDSINYITKGKLLNDMDEYAKGIASKHVKPFTKIKRRDFFDEVRGLKDSSDKYDVDEMLVRMLCINALIGDEHTNILYNGRDIFPFVCYCFDDGVYITGTDGDNMDMLYSRVIAVNETPISDVRRRLAGLSSDKNDAGYMLATQKYLFDPFVIHGLNIAPSRNKVEYKLVTHRGDTVKVQPVAKDKRKWGMGPGFNQSVFLRSNNKEYYWYKYFDTGNYIYFKYEHCYDRDKDHIFLDVEKKLKTEIRERNPQKIIIDMRDNGGGYPAILEPFIDWLSRSSLNKKGGIFVLVGRHTFSAAVINSTEIRDRTYAQLIGEETSGSVNFFGGVKFFKLPETKLMVMYSTSYWASDEKYDGSLRPDVVIPEKLSDYSKGIDAALEYAISH